MNMILTPAMIGALQEKIQELVGVGNSEMDLDLDDE